MLNEVGQRVCGVDFDNTIVSYDEVLALVAKERGLLDNTEIRTKRKIRDQIRQLPNGEIEWQKCQALIYGPRIDQSQLIEGVPEFFRLCSQHNTRVYIVSHKTQSSPFDTTGTNLRQAAMDWMTRHRFFEADGLGLHRDDVFFADSRREKTTTISRLRCSYFIDDLVETFMEETFPQATARILYDPDWDGPLPEGITIGKSWKAIREYLFAR